MALAQAIVNEPKVLLLDEPLSAIDSQLRKSLQRQIQQIPKELNITTIFVTHDQDEAMILSDVVHVMNDGKFEQSGKPTDVYTHPKTHFVASFMGNKNILAPEQFQHFSREHTGTSIAIRPKVIDSSRLPFEPDEERYTLHLSER